MEDIIDFVQDLVIGRCLLIHSGKSAYGSYTNLESPGGALQNEYVTD